MSYLYEKYVLFILRKIFVINANSLLCYCMCVAYLYPNHMLSCTDACTQLSDVNVLDMIIVN